MSPRTLAFSSASGRAFTSTCSRPARAVSSARPQRAITVNCSRNLSQQQGENADSRSLNRRSLLLASSAAIAMAPWRQAEALEGAGAGFSSYTDPLDGFTLSVPPGWVVGEGELPGNSSFTGASGARRTLAWFPEGANPRDVNVTLVITNVSVEFTKLGSFGSPSSFGSSLVASQDRSYLLRAPEWARGKEPIQIAKLVDASELSGRYYVEYTVQKLPEPQRHLYSLLALGYNGMYNRLFTLTAQTLEADRAQYESTLLAMIKSLSVPQQRF
ncbi:hypothetical protein PLESTB_001805500 [Pleodorina starrii]|uniref:PsbP C-terminal domain-containing protein n=1 Tax=Pleodorina starrii TaxID=330485 RepID=A0A9W6C1M7_9CHLO|nr:hypothetical protein PLESTM_002093500 [Pleodorina starrii]GLC61810.1 hypothetical protein PLESTB_001805500 [Pleodorina starrii]GLC69848.1 hypothetical protein PLESTF_000887200 [Pleodorina starrii]